MPLLGNQQEAVNQLLTYFKQHHNQGGFLSGENGVGKTYITSAFIHQYLKEHPRANFLIISPTHMLKKWQTVLTEYNPDVDIQQLKSKQNRLPAQITIVSNRQLSRTKEINKQINFIVYDEIHEVNPNRANYQHLENLIYQNLKPNVLGLTGTVFSQSTRNLLKIIDLLRPDLYNNATNFGFNINKINFFEKYIWQFVSVTINLHNVNAKLNKQDINQEIMPIHLIKLTTEEKMFYVLTRNRMNRLNKNGAQLAGELIDFPRTNQFVTKHTRKTHANSAEVRQTRDLVLNQLDRNLRWQNQPNISRQESYVSALSLSEIKLTNSQKFNQLKQIIKDNDQQTILILLNGDQNLTRLAKAIKQATNRPVKTMNKNIKPNNRADFINDWLNADNQNILIANANHIKTGIDLNSVSVIVWYQLLPELADILQTQRRARRLSSKHDSKVYYLAYQDTYQEKLIKELSKSNTNNAATYNWRSEDALSQLQGILFADFK